MDLTLTSSPTDICYAFTNLKRVLFICQNVKFKAFDRVDPYCMDSEISVFYFIHIFRRIACKLSMHRVLS